MILFLCAQNLDSLWLGWIEESEFVRLEERKSPPEGYVRELDDFLKGISFSDVKGICLVAGPGSFTSSRVSLTIANTLHFVYGVPLFLLENPAHLHPRELLKQKGVGKELPAMDFAHVAYDRPAHITKPHGDKSVESQGQKC